MFQRTTLVTGASHALGLEFVRQCLMRGDQVIAAARNTARISALADLRAKYGTLEFLSLDAADAASVADAVSILESITRSIDRLIVTQAEPALHERTGESEREAHIDSLSATSLVEHYRRHAVAPVLLARTLLPMLTAAGSARILFLSTLTGSIAAKVNGGNYATCASAAGLHMLARTLAHDLADRKINVCIGNVGDSPNPSEQSIAELLDVAENLPANRNGAFIDSKGADCRW